MCKFPNITLPYLILLKYFLSPNWTLWDFLWSILMYIVCWWVFGGRLDVTSRDDTKIKPAQVSLLFFPQTRNFCLHGLCSVFNSRAFLWALLVVRPTCQQQGMPWRFYKYSSLWAPCEGQQVQNIHSYELHTKVNRLESSQLLQI